MQQLTREYGASTTIPVAVFAQDGIALEADTVAAADVQISKDGGAFAQTTNAPTVVGTDAYFTVTLTATEMQAKVIVLRVQDAGTAFAPEIVLIETFGNASAQFPDDTVDANIVQVTGNATPATALAANIASLDVAVSSRATPAQVNTEADTALADYDPPTKAELDTAVANVTVGTIATAALAAIADKLLGRSIAGGADGGRTVTSAFRRIRNRNVLSAGTLTTYEEDDSTTDHTAAVTTAAGDPITSVDPV